MLPSEPPPHRRAALSSSLLAAIAFFILALAISTFFCGDIGVYNDDYFCNQRDPVTHEAHDLVMVRPWHLWRPLTRVILIPLTTLLWPHPWALHAISAVLHGIVVWLFYLLLRRFNVRAALAAPIALGFMLYPVHFEAVLWIDIICTLMSMVLVLGIWNTYLWWLRSSQHAPGLLRFLILPSLAGAAWCAAAMNEQPPAVLAALPLAPLAVGFAIGSTPRRRIVRTALPVFAVSVGLLIYLRGYLKHAPRLAGSTLSSTLSTAGHNFAELFTKIPRELRLKNVAQGALQQGWETVAANPMRAALLFGVLLIAALVWYHTRTRAAPRALPERVPATRWPALGALGTAWFTAAWLPVAAAHAITSPRLYYPALPGLALVLAALLSPLAFRLDRLTLPVRRVARMAGHGITLAGTLVALLMWVGIQINYQRRHEADAAEIAPLVQACATSVPPGTFFVPVKLESRTCKTASSRLDAFFAHCWTWEFASGWRLQYALRRNDVYTFSTYYGIGVQGLYLDDTDPERFILLFAAPAQPYPADLRQIAPKIPDLRGFRRMAISRCVFFDTPALGHTRIYTKLRLNLPGQPPRVIPVAPLATSPALAALPELILDLSPMPAEKRSVPKPRPQ